jgi:4-hydroxybenzoate polyprenyltransferase
LAYSLPPLRLTARPGLDVIANATGYGAIATLLGGAPHPSLDPGASLLVFGTTLAVSAVFLHTTLLDLEGDRRTGKRSIGVVLGPVATRIVACIAALGAAACCVGQGPALRIATALLAIASAATILAPARVTSRAIVVGATALFAVVAATTWPPFWVGIVGLGIATRVYYARRFALRYPAL